MNRQELMKAVERETRSHAQGSDALYHGTRSVRAILCENRIRKSPSGYRAVSLTRSPAMAAHWACLERDYGEEEGAVLVLDRRKLAQRFQLEPFRDPIWDGSGQPAYATDESEERIMRDVTGLSAFLLAVVRVEDLSRPRPAANANGEALENPEDWRLLEANEIPS